MIIGISGKKQSGKDTVGKIIQCLTAKYSIDDILYTLNKENNAGFLPFSDESNWQIKKLAYKVKQILSILTGISIEDMEKEEVKKSYLGEEWNRWTFTFNGELDNNTVKFATHKEALDYSKEWDNVDLKVDIIEQQITVRQAMQWIGTDLFRDKFHPQTWCNALFSEYKCEGTQYFQNGKRVEYLCTYPDKVVIPVSDPVSKEWPVVKKNETFKEVSIYPNWIISDVRFENECQAIKDRDGILIRVNRSFCPKCGESENLHWDISTHKLQYCNECDYVFDNHASETALDDYEGFDYIIDNSEGIPELIEKVKDILIKLNLN
jgi:hypothetical protein